MNKKEIEPGCLCVIIKDKNPENVGLTVTVIDWVHKGEEVKTKLGSLRLPGSGWLVKSDSDNLAITIRLHEGSWGNRVGTRTGYLDTAAFAPGELMRIDGHEDTDTKTTTGHKRPVTA